MKRVLMLLRLLKPFLMFFWPVLNIALLFAVDAFFGNKYIPIILLIELIVFLLIVKMLHTYIIAMIIMVTVGMIAKILYKYILNIFNIICDTLKFSEISDTLLILIVVAYIFITTIVPIIITSYKLRRSYRTSINMTSYWMRCYNKIIIDKYIFYRDELFTDLLISTIYGVFIWGIGLQLILSNISVINIIFKYIFIGSLFFSFLLWLLVEIQRLYIIKDELNIAKIMYGEEFINKKFEQMYADCSHYILKF